MDNLGKAIYFASFALIFVFAASISIYLYSTVNVFVKEANASNNISFRAENTSNEDLRNFKRKITVGEILITLQNMDQMHVTSLKVDETEVNINDFNNNTEEFARLNTKLKDMDKNKEFTYSSSGECVTYKSK